MKRLVCPLLLLVFASAFEDITERRNRLCDNKITLYPRPHSVSILEFGAIGDGKTLNTVAFENAIFYLKSFADKGGAQLFVPAGSWLTGSFNLTSHLTLFLERGATILGSQYKGSRIKTWRFKHKADNVVLFDENRGLHVEPRDFSHWDVVEPLPSYGRGIELPGARYGGLINGKNLSDVVITGYNGTIDGQGSVWWEQFKSHSLNHSRPHLVEFIDSNGIIVSNLTFLNPPAWTIHPVYCSNVRVENITAYSPPESPSTCGIVPDSSKSICIESCNIRMGNDGIVLKSGWDEYGISFGKSSSNVHIKRVKLQSSSGSALAFGSEMSGGIFDVHVEKLNIKDSLVGIEFKTTRGRGGYMKEIFISNVQMENLQLAILATGRHGTHPHEKYDPNALPVVNNITFENFVGKNIKVAGKFKGIYESPFSSICLRNVSFSISLKSSISWVCSDVFGFSDSVHPEPCDNLAASFSNSSLSCFSFDQSDRIAVL